MVPPRQIGAFTVNEKGWKAANPAHGGLIVTTSIHPDPCKKPHGDYVNQLSVMNKLDYVKLHGYEFHLATRVIDKSLPKLCALSMFLLASCCNVLTESRLIRQQHYEANVVNSLLLVALHKVRV